MIDIDDRQFPLVIYRFSGEVSLAELDAYLKRQEELLSRGKPIISMAIAQDLKMWEARVLRRQASWMKEHSELLRKYLLGAAIVISTPAVRGMLKAFLWIQPIQQPYRVCADVPEALAWLRTRCREAGASIQLPSSI
jgi:hypothetical protein